MSKMYDDLKSLRESKEHLTKVKTLLQEEIADANKSINRNSEELTSLKNKLRYHKEKQITDNIERLEYQLRNNNYKPKEEQRILDEISMLRRSIKTLREYLAKQAANKKFREERSRLIDQRNDNYSKLRGICLQEDEIRKGIVDVRDAIATNKKSIDELRQQRGVKEREWQEQQRAIREARQRKYEERQQQRIEKARQRQEEQNKLWEEYEASIVPFQEECDLCRGLLSYLNSHNQLSTPATPATGRVTPSTPRLQDAEGKGSFYCKEWEQTEEPRLNKKDRAKAKKEQRKANKVKDLSHTPDVYAKFAKLSLLPPKKSEDIAASLIAIQDKLTFFEGLAEEEKKRREEHQVAKDQKKGDSFEPSDGSAQQEGANKEVKTAPVRPNNLQLAVPLPVISSPHTFSTGDTARQPHELYSQKVTPQLFLPTQNLAPLDSASAGISWARRTAATQSKLPDVHIGLSSQTFCSTPSGVQVTLCTDMQRSPTSPAASNLQRTPPVLLNGKLTPPSLSSSPSSPVSSMAKPFQSPSSQTTCGTNMHNIRPLDNQINVFFPTNSILSKNLGLGLSEMNNNDSSKNGSNYNPVVHQGQLSICPSFQIVNSLANEQV
ncbi:uncharacterized protein LOC143040018 isoform X2 [Oratosquilla oratoria]